MWNTKNKSSVFSGLKSRMLHLSFYEKISVYYFFGLIKDILIMVAPYRIIIKVRMLIAEWKVKNAVR